MRPWLHAPLWPVLAGAVEPPAPALPHLQRIADLARLWSRIQWVHPTLADGRIKWVRALLDVLPAAARSARSAADHDLLDLLPDHDGGPEEACARKGLSQALQDAVLALPADQPEVFVAHEIDGFSFKAMARASGESIHTLLSRMHYAVKALRQRPQALHDELMRA